MEYYIAVFAGVWVSAAGVLAYYRIRKDFSGPADSRKKEGWKP